MPAAIWNDEQMEVTMIKRAILTTLNDGGAVGYRERGFLMIPRNPTEDSAFVVLRSDAPDTQTPFPAKRIVHAVDHFFEQFYLEESFNFNDFQFYFNGDITASSMRWDFIKERFNIGELIDGIYAPTN